MNPPIPVAHSIIGACQRLSITDARRVKYPTPAAHSIDGACHRMSIGKTKLYELINQGRIKVIRLANKRLITEIEIQRVLVEEEDSAHEVA